MIRSVLLYFTFIHYLSHSHLQILEKTCVTPLWQLLSIPSFTAKFECSLFEAFSKTSSTQPPKVPAMNDNKHNIDRVALRVFSHRHHLEDVKTADVASVPSIEKAYADPPITKSIRIRPGATSSTTSVCTNSADSTYYSGPPSRPSTPISSGSGDQSKRRCEHGTVHEWSRPRSYARTSTSSTKRQSATRQQVCLENQAVESDIDREIPDTQLSISDLEAPTRNHLRLKPEQPPTRVLFGPAPKSSSEDLGEERTDLEDSRVQAAAVVKEVDNTGTGETDRIDLSEPNNARGLNASSPVAFPTTQLPLKDRKVDVDGSLRGRARRKILAHKHSMQAFQAASNGFCIFATWFWPKYYYILLPFITATVALNVIMIGSLIVRAIWNKISPEKTIQPASPESMVLLIPCYNETREELHRSLESLVAQRKIENHKQAIIVVCDGKVRGPGMEKTTADYLLEDILTDRVERRRIDSAYTAWDQQPMDVVIQRGRYQGVPYYCIIKQQNQGKRDSLILVRSFLYNFNRRTESPSTIFSPGFFNAMCSFMVDDGGMDNCVHLIGMDADTVFDDDCIYELLQESRYPHTVGVCGYVAVDWKDFNWNPWRLYQSAEYTIAQCLRRLHQSMVTHKVSCLPGCCQLLKICEETCGDHVLLELFGYCPVLTDSLLKQIRATASEDRNHVCHMLSARPKSQTRQALKAKAYTDVPNTWSVFLSQRRRWTLGATSNDLLLAFARGVQWFERILAIVNVVTWTLNPFIIASLASFIFAILGK